MYVNLERWSICNNVASTSLLAIGVFLVAVQVFGRERLISRG